jgi:hypothetical protein
MIKSIKEAVAVAKSIPARMKANANYRKQIGNAEIIDMVRNNMGQMDKGDESDPLFRARTMYKQMQYDQEYAAKRSNAKRNQ